MFKIYQMTKNILIVLTLLNISSQTQANSLDPNQIRGKTKNTPVSVLQNRYFLKAMRPEVGIFAGTMLNEAYTNTKYFGLRGSLFITEWIGAEVQYVTTSVSDSDDRIALSQLKYRRLEEDTIVSPDPEVNPINSVIDATAVFAPFYGKLNLLDMFIVYTDLFLTGGLSKVTTDQGDHIAFAFGSGLRLYFSDKWSAHIDYKDRIYSEKRAGKDSTKHAYSFDIGASYFFK